MRFSTVVNISLDSDLLTSSYCRGGHRICERIGIERIPLLAVMQGGVAERFRRCREASADREAGVVFRLRTKGKPPRLHQLRWLRNIFLMTQPPLLAVMQGEE